MWLLPSGEEGKRHRDGHVKTVRDRSGAVTGQRRPGPQAGKGAVGEASGGAWPRTHLGFHCSPQSYQRMNFCCLKTPSFW